ncbi:MAG: NAD(P)-dependent oxidoreductase [Kiritimatiellia bacterium]
MNTLPPEDLEHILRHTGRIWKDLRNARIFITGGTGFFGRWLLGSFLAANDRFGLKARATVLSRNPARFKAACPWLAGHPAIRMIKGDVRDFTFPKGKFTHVIHGAVDAKLKLIREKPALTFDTITRGTRRVLDLAAARGANKMLFVSSGAVYGRQGPGAARLPEEYRGAPDLNDAYAVYGGCLRAAEALCAACAERSGFSAPVARCFSFVGPHLPLDQHFAIGNFIRDALSCKTIRLESDGTPRRSYLYAADLAIWLWTILLRGKNGRVYNVGSEKAISLAETARIVARSSGNNLKVIMARKPRPDAKTNIYVPCTIRARTELGLKEFICLRDAIRRTIEFYRSVIPVKTGIQNKTF